MSAEAYQESQHFFVLWTGSQPPRALGQLLARSVLVHEEKWKSAKDGDGTSDEIHVLPAVKPTSLDMTKTIVDKR